MKKYFSSLAAIGIVVAANATFAQDHGHLNVGATGTNQNDQLIFDNGVYFATNTGYVSTLTYSNTGRFAGYFNANITGTVLPATAGHGGPAPNAPALGAYVCAQIVSVDGPPDGQFGFWDTGAASPTIVLNSGGSGTNVYPLSGNNGVPGTDPFGHIHGRRFTATEPGIYVVGFRAFDFSTNGLGGESIHSASEILYIYFQAGVVITSISRMNDAATITFGATAGREFTLEYSPTPADPNAWVETGGSLSGNDSLQSLTDAGATGTHRFYRIKGVPAN